MELMNHTYLFKTTPAVNTLEALGMFASPMRKMPRYLHGWEGKRVCDRHSEMRVSSWMPENDLPVSRLVPGTDNPGKCKVLHLICLKRTLETQQSSTSCSSKFFLQFSYEKAVCLIDF